MQSCNAYRRLVPLTGHLRVPLVLLALASMAAAPLHWRDTATGLAIGGFDPIAYFNHGSPKQGREAHEVVWRGVTWRFVNSGNRAAFQKNPSVYAPKFAGYDVTAIADGRAIVGHPAVWAIRDDKLYLFHESVNRRLWAKDPEGVEARAARMWKLLALDLPSAASDY